MGKKWPFFAALLRYNVKHLFCSGENELLLAWGLEAFPGSGYPEYANLLKVGWERFGMAGLLLVNFCLSFVAFLVVLGCDLSAGACVSQCAVLGIHLGCLYLCARKFDVFRPANFRNFLKLAYMGITLIFRHSWSIAYLFLALFENIVCLG